MAPYQGGWGSSHRQQQQFGRGQGGSKKEPWYETVKFDRSVNERPKWNLTSYAHQREKDNDVVGDISPEEVRYANMLSLQQGVHVSTLKDEFRKATRERVDVFQGLTRRRQAPSIEGRPMMARMDGIKNMSWVIQGHSAQGMGASFGQTGIQPSSGFGQPSTASPFGQASQAGQNAFGGGGGAAAATTSTVAAGGSSSGFGGTFGQQPAQASSGFGQPSTASPFGQAAQGSQAPFGAASAPGSGGGFGGTFGQQPAQASSSFGQASTASPFGQAGQNAFGAAAAATSTPGTGSGFGGTFGQQPAQASSGFGQSSTASPFGQAAQGSQAPFGAASAPGSGGGFGGTFGQQPAQSSSVSPFGQINQGSQTPFGAAAGAAGAGTGSGFGGTFGQTNSQPSSGFGQFSSASPFGQINPSLQMNNGNATPGTIQAPTETKPLTDEEKALWMTDTFERKGIPLSAPPPHVC
ncbi:hypothetical protein M9435_000401 [Picochlorum sp. BPE23]|nr:hypothetical protein M9435_000401 [Picochlorum sp. BPE23]